MDPIATNSTTDSFDLHLDNAVAEDLVDETEHSTASQFTVTLQKNLNLNALIFLRAINCELTLQKYHLGSLPLSTVKNESITVYFEVSKDIVTVNRHLNTSRTNSMNKDPLTITLDDTICSTPKELLTYINSLIEKRINYTIIAKQLNLVFDAKVMSLNPTSSLDDKTIKLIQKYLEIAIFCREKIHSTLSDAILEPNNIRPR